MVAPSPHELPLDQRLVEIALDLLPREGIEGVTLRRLAREAGVSHGAPLRHFASLSALRAEVAARGFTMLSAAIEGASQSLRPGAGALARLHAAGHGYARVALTQPTLFSLMFRPDLLAPETPSFQREAAGAFDHLVRLVRAAQDAGWHADRPTRALAGSVWAALHGFASLWAQGAFQGAVGDTDFEAALETTLTLVLDHQPGGPA